MDELLLVFADTEEKLERYRERLTALGEAISDDEGGDNDDDDDDDEEEKEEDGGENEGEGGDGEVD